MTIQNWFTGPPMRGEQRSEDNYRRLRHGLPTFRTTFHRRFRRLATLEAVPSPGPAWFGHYGMPGKGGTTGADADKGRARPAFLSLFTSIATTHTTTAVSQRTGALSLVEITTTPRQNHRYQPKQETTS